MNLLPPPGPERRRQLTLLSVLVVVLAVYFGYRYWPTAGSGAASSNAEVRNATTKDKLQVPTTVRLTELEGAPPGSDPGRNPFRFGQPPAPPTPPRVEAPYVPPPPQAPPPSPVPQVPLQLLSLGKVTDTNQRLINFIDDTGTNFWVRPVEGEVIDGKYKLVKVNADSVIVAFRDGSGQKPLYLVK